MFVVRFSAIRVVEHTDARAFEQRVSRWMAIREAENIYLLGPLPAILATASSLPAGMRISERLFTVEDAGELLAVGILYGSGCLCMTWTTEPAAIALAEFIAGAGCKITNVYGPSHVSLRFAEKWAELTRQRLEFSRSERVYQLTHCTYVPPASGRLELATAADTPIIVPWVRSFVEETQYEGDLTAEQLVQDLLNGQTLYLWKDPQAVSMAAWLSPTPNGGSINFVFTPREFRRRGHGKAVVSALGSLMLSRGRKYCFILADSEDPLTHSLYHDVGARTLCELLRCTMVPQASEPAQIKRPGMPVAPAA